jgi:hypothetical protein
MTPPRVTAISEDLRFRLFLVPAIRKIARASGVEPSFEGFELTNGCRVQVLIERYEALRGRSDTIVSGADAKHGGKHQTVSRP